LPRYIARAEWIGFTTGHEPWQARLALNHFRWRQPVRPLFRAANALGARPSEALTADADAVANCLAVADGQVKSVRRIDDDGSRRLDCRVIDKQRDQTAVVARDAFAKIGIHPYCRLSSCQAGINSAIRAYSIFCLEANMVELPDKLRSAKV